MRKMVILVIAMMLLSMIPVPATSSISMDQSLSTADHIFNSWGASTAMGIDVDIVGDVNDDGFDDIIMCDYFNDSFNGNCYMFFGRDSGWTTDLSQANVTFYWENPGDYLGVPEGLGDVNGDGIDDFLIGMPDIENPMMHTGAAFIYFGKSAGWQSYTNVSHSDATIWGSQLFDLVGGTTAGVGDVNGDGLNDIAISTPSRDFGKGYVWLYFGKVLGWNNTINLTDADASFHGYGPDSLCGFDVAGGDVNGDGFSDVVIAEPSNNWGFPPPVSPGYVHVVFGREGPWSMDVNLTDDANATLMGEHYDDYAGRSLDVPGDVNGDGFEDILVGTNENDEVGALAGKSYLYLGHADNWVDDFNLSNADASFRGEAATDQSGERVSGAGDINGDGYADFMIGASYNDDGALANQGQIYLFLGKTSGWAVNTSLGSADGSWLGQANTDWAPNSISGGGDVNGDVLDDILIGVTNAGNGGRTYLIFPYDNTRPDNPTDVTIYWDEARTDPATYAMQNDTVFVELVGTDQDASNINFAQVRITCEPSDVFGFVLDLRETGVNTGTFVGNFTIGNHTNEGLRTIRALDGSRVRATSVTNSSAWYEINVGGGVRIEMLGVQNAYAPTIYAERSSIVFRVNVSDSLGHEHLDHVNLTLPLATGRINYTWFYGTNSFIETEDLGFFARLDGASFADFPNENRTSIVFRIFFNWTFPDELLHGVGATAVTKDHDTATRFINDAYRVENDLDLNGVLSATGTFGRILKDGDILAPGEPVKLTGLMVTYQGTTNMYPPEGAFDVTVSDDDGNSWVDKESAGAYFQVDAEVTNETDPTEVFSINITGVPPECANNSASISFQVDGDEVTFSDPAPSSDVWQASKSLEAAVNITDTGGSLVKGDSIEYRLKPSGGVWGLWNSAGMTGSSPSILASVIVTMADGPANMIQWRASDGVGNKDLSGNKTTSGEYNVMVDTVPPDLSLPWPAEGNYSIDLNVTFGIRITDPWSQVDGGSIEYTYSTDNGTTWSNWIDAGYSGMDTVFDCQATVQFLNGSENLVRWRASDTVGNGPFVSDEIRIVVNTEGPPPSNRRPVIEEIGDRTVEVGRLLELTINATDPDNDTLEFRVADGPDGMIITEGGKVTYAAIMSDTGTHTVTIRVSDGFLHALATFDLTVTYNAHSMAVLNPEVLQGDLKGDITVEGTTTAGSLDVVSVKYSIDEGGPADALGTGTWSFTIVTKELKDGPHKLNITSTDAAGMTTSLFFDINVKNKKEVTPGNDGLGGMLMYILLVVIIVVVLVVALVLLKRKRGGGETTQQGPTEPMTQPQMYQSQPEHQMYQQAPPQQPPPQQPPPQQPPPQAPPQQPPPQQPPQEQ